MKIKIVLFLTLFFAFPISTYAATFTEKEVSLHNSISDCYVIFQNKVYDITVQLAKHEKYMGIDQYCGTDITSAFQTKGPYDRDHREQSYALLGSFEIGDLETKASSSSQINSEGSLKPIPNNPYNFVLPIGITALLYLSTLFLVKSPLSKKSNLFSTSNHNLLWNSIMVLAVVPTLIFPLLLALRYSYPVISTIPFDFVYWHAEFSFVFATLCVLHFIMRFKQYLAPAQIMMAMNDAQKTEVTSSSSTASTSSVGSQVQDTSSNSRL